MARDLDLLLEEILAATRDCMRYATGLSDQEFLAMPDADRDRYRALKNALVEIGEAIKGLPTELLERHPDIDWKGTAGLRDIVAHQYFRIDMERLLPVLREEFPILSEAVEREAEAARADTPSRHGNRAP